jgi:endonuclease I
MKPFYATTMLLYSVKAFHYIPYKQIRPLFLEMYHIIHPKNVSLEHIVPQSLFKKLKPEACRDMHNIMLFPILLNSHRSNYRYSSELVLDDTTTILNNNGEKCYYTHPFNHIGICLKSNKKRYFYPRPFYRGKIARACMYMAMTYPELRDTIFCDVIDPFVLLTWHHEHPVSGFEIRKNDAILKLQGNENVYVSKPELLLKDMESYLGKRIQIYHHYKW